MMRKIQNTIVEHSSLITDWTFFVYILCRNHKSIFYYDAKRKLPYDFFFLLKGHFHFMMYMESSIIKYKSYFNICYPLNKKKR